MYRNAQRLLRLINQIIDIRKMDLGKNKLRPSQNNITGFISEVVHAFEFMAEAKGIKLRVESGE